MFFIYQFVHTMYNSNVQLKGMEELKFYHSILSWYGLVTLFTLYLYGEKTKKSWMIHIDGRPIEYVADFIQNKVGLLQCDNHWVELSYVGLSLVKLSVFGWHFIQSIKADKMLKEIGAKFCIKSITYSTGLPSMCIIQLFLSFLPI